jgi:hypothetical protein
MYTKILYIWKNSKVKHIYVINERITIRVIYPATKQLIITVKPNKIAFSFEIRWNNTSNVSIFYYNFEMIKNESDHGAKLYVYIILDVAYFIFAVLYMIGD